MNRPPLDPLAHQVAGRYLTEVAQRDPRAARTATEYQRRGDGHLEAVGDEHDQVEEDDNL